MASTIRIDDEVYAWLQKNARAFEDTPNSVLRRIAGLDGDSKKRTSKRSSQKMSTRTLENRALNGRELNKKWGVGVRHALYHKDGHWYNNLERFPGALFDPNGYLKFETEQEYKDCSQISVGEETNVHGGISSIPGYIRVE